MASVNELFPEYIFKYGPAGILAVWLFSVNNRLSDVEQRLYRCLEERARVEIVDPKPIIPSTAALRYTDFYGMRGDEPKIKKNG